jgi:hypothetical protein
MQQRLLLLQKLRLRFALVSEHMAMSQTPEIRASVHSRTADDVFLCMSLEQACLPKGKEDLEGCDGGLGLHVRLEGCCEVVKLRRGVAVDWR